MSDYPVPTFEPIYDRRQMAMLSPEEVAAVENKDMTYAEAMLRREQRITAALRQENRDLADDIMFLERRLGQVTVMALVLAAVCTALLFWIGRG